MKKYPFFLSVLLLASCVTEILVDDVTEANTDNSYVFARLSKNYIADDEVYLICLSSDGMREHMLSFNAKDSLAAKEVLPGEYLIAGYRVITGGGIQDIGFFNDLNQRMMDRFTVEPGEAVYLGDYVVQAHAKDVSSSSPGSLRVIIQDQYQTAKYQLRARFPGFDAILIRNLMAR